MKICIVNWYQLGGMKMKEEIDFVRNGIAAKLRGLRAELGESQEKVAKLSGLNIGTIIRYENGSTTQSLDKLIVLANYYNVDLTYFFNLNYENMYSVGIKQEIQ